MSAYSASRASACRKAPRAVTRLDDQPELEQLAETLGARQLADEPQVEGLARDRRRLCRRVRLLGEIR